MRFSHEVLARWPYLVLVAAACPTILTCMTMASGDESGLTGLDAIIHDVGLFFFPGKVASDCSDGILRKSYFLLHTTMALLYVPIVYANQKGFAVVRRIFFFSICYIAVGITLPVMLACTGDFELFAPVITPVSLKGKEQKNKILPKGPLSDADYMLFCQLFIFGGWTVLSHIPYTSCEEEYVHPPATTVFDYGTIVWAGLCMIPLLLYPWRGSLPAVTTYRGLAIFNLVATILFILGEVVWVLSGRSDSNDLQRVLLPYQQEQFYWHKNAAILDYLFTIATMGAMIFRTGSKSSGVIALLCLVLPNVALPLLFHDLKPTRKARSD